MRRGDSGGGDDEIHSVEQSRRGLAVVAVGEAESDPNLYPRNGELLGTPCQGLVRRVVDCDHVGCPVPGKVAGGGHAGPTEADDECPGRHSAAPEESQSA